jgi:multidrug resistance efflux pump
VLLQQDRVQLDADFNEEQATAIKQGQRTPSCP